MSQYLQVTVGAHKPDLHSRIRVAVGHIAVNEKNIKASYLGKPNVSRKRHQMLSALLNDVVEHGVTHPEQRTDLLVLPETSVPHRSASFIAHWARNHQIGVICGLEHRLDSQRRAWNELLAALPYRAKNGMKACVPVRRLKKYYSPHEAFVLTNNQITIPDVPSKCRYQLFHWLGVSFAVYNCYELASIEDRSIFKGKVDFIVCSEFNPDVNYFSNIVESAARDLHCYVVQVNSAQFGDSRIVSPSKTEKLNPLRIKGGVNQTFLTMELPLEKLREHQTLLYGLQKDSEDYKPTPPDFPIEHVRARIKLGQLGVKK
jgi:hypothetical protein